MNDVRLAVIGGSGFYRIEGLQDVEEVAIDTPFGSPSERIVVGTLGDIRTAFLPRHGVGHRILPSELPQRANIWALASLGVRYIISVSAVGSLREEIAPLHMVVPDQLIDRTQGRISTFFGRGMVAHVAFDQPFCPRLRGLLCDAAGDLIVHSGGTSVVIDGPAFSTRAESELYRGWGASVIGMTALPEAKLAREAGMCYATLACVTDYDTWHESAAKVSADLIIRNLLANVASAKAIVSRAVNALRTAAASCGCSEAMTTAIVTPMELVPEQTKQELAPILARYWEVARA